MLPLPRPLARTPEPPLRRPRPDVVCVQGRGLQGAIAFATPLEGACMEPLPIDAFIAKVPRQDRPDQQLCRRATTNPFDDDFELPALLNMDGSPCQSCPKSVPRTLSARCRGNHCRDGLRAS